MRLNDTIIRNIQPGSRPIKLFDGDGLYMLVQPNGSRWWRTRYFVDGLEKTLSVGVYPEVSLKRACERRHEIRTQVASGSNPSDDRKAQRRGREQTFELVAREWWEKRRHLWKDEYAHVILTRFSHDIFPYIGKRSVAKLEAPDFLECLRSHAVCGCDSPGAARSSRRSKRCTAAGLGSALCIDHVSLGRWRAAESDRWLPGHIEELGLATL